MTRIGIRELNQHTSRYVAMMEAGETIEITDRGDLVGRMVPVNRGETILDRMVAAGKADPPTIDPRTLPPLPPPSDNINTADALIAMREEERW